MELKYKYDFDTKTVFIRRPEGVKAVGGRVGVGARPVGVGVKAVGGRVGVGAKPVGVGAKQFIEFLREQA